MAYINSAGQANIYRTPPKLNGKRLASSRSSAVDQQVNEWAAYSFPLPEAQATSPLRIHSLIPLPVPEKKGMTLLPSEENFESPLKRKREIEKSDEQTEQPVQKKLFYENSDSDSKAASSTSIEKQCALIRAFSDDQEIHKLVEDILNTSLTLEQKHAELGLLYFYLTRDKTFSKLPKGGYYLEARYAEIKKRLLDDISIHQEKCPDACAALVPSGKVVGLIRPFMRLIFTPNGVFNPGGCEAVKLLLNTDLTIFITEEMRAQILTIIEKLLTEEDFHKRFLKEHSSIHPDAAELIRVDLFLKPGEAVGNLHACWAKLTSCFSLISQTDEGNCFAIAIVFDFYRRQPEFILDLFDQLIEKGAFTFEGKEIPLALLIEGRKTYDKDFKASLQVSKAADLSSMIVVQQLFGKEISNDSSKEKTLGKIFKEEFQSAESEAKLRYLAFKQNLFQHSILALFQFVSNNTSIKTADEFSFKNDFIAALLNHFPNSGSQKQLITRFSIYLKDYFWFIDYRNGAGEVSGDRICFRYNSQGLLLESDEESDFKPFSVIRRLFFLKEGNFIAIDTLSDFADCISDLFAAFVLAKNEKQSAVKKIEKFIEDKSEFIKYLAKSIRNLNREQGVRFSWKKYHASDAFMLLTSGGFPSLITQWASQTNNLTYKSVLLHKKRIDTFFIDLCKKIKGHEKKYSSFLKDQNPTLTIDAYGHAFILCPSLFEQFFRVENPSKLLKQKVYERSVQLLTQTPSLKLIKRLLFDAFDSEYAKKTLKRLPKSISSIEELYSEVKKKVSKRRLIQFNESFSKLLTQVSYNSFSEKLPDLLSLHSVNIDSDKLQEILAAIKKEISLTRKFFSPAELSDAIHKVLLTHTHSFISAHLIEDSLADLFELPYAIKIGNLNWVEVLSETPEHALLVIKFDLIEKKYVFYMRKQGNDTVFDHDLASDLLLKENILSLAL